MMPYERIRIKEYGKVRNMGYKVSVLSALAVCILLTASIAALAGNDGVGKEHGTEWIFGNPENGFIPVTDIDKVPTGATIGIPLTLTGSIIPINATDQEIIWSIKDAGTTGATISGDIFTASGIGTATVTASIGGELVMVSSGGYFTAAIRSDGTLWTWGANWRGYLGDGTNVNSNVPIQVGTATNWVSVSAGDQHSLAIDSDGKLWAWGYNYYGQLGDGTTTDSFIPIEIRPDKEWASVSTGWSYTMAIDTDGKLWAWGNNWSGQLGDGTTTDSLIPIEIRPDKEWKTVATGGYHTLAIDTDGKLWAWGANWSGQLGDGTTTDSLIPVQIRPDKEWASAAMGVEDFTIAIDSDGKLWAWGGNWNGQLGDGTTTSSTTPIEIRPDKDWTMVSAGWYYAMALDTDGNIWGWGNNGSGQLGDGTNTNRNTPHPMTHPEGMEWVYLSVGNAEDSFHTSAIDSDGRLWGWGYNYYGQLGDGTVVTTSTPVQTVTDRNWAMVSVGFYHTMAIDSDGKLWAFGVNWNGQLGDGTTMSRNLPVMIMPDKDWTMVSAGSQFTLAIDSDGKLWAWGANIMGQLGDGTTIQKTSPVQIGTATNWAHVSAGDSHSMAIDTDGKLWAWGYNLYGQLGNGAFVITANPNPIQIGSDTDWAMVSAGGSHTAAIKTNGELYAWGQNWYGQLGDGSLSNKSTPVKVGSDTDWAMVSAGSNHTAAIKADGSLWTWGHNLSGQLGLGDFGSGTDRVTPQPVTSAGGGWAYVSTGGQGTMAVKTNGELYAWGYNGEGQLGLGDNTDRDTPQLVTSASDGWVYATTGGQHTMAIDSDGKLWGYGSNYYGQLGDGNSSYNYSPVKTLTEPHFAKDFQIEVLSTYTVSGIVTFNGTVQEGLIVTYTTDNGTTFQMAMTDMDGRYSVTADHDEIVEITEVSHPTLTTTVSQILPISYQGNTSDADFDLMEFGTHVIPAPGSGSSLWYLWVLLVPVILVLIGHGWWLFAAKRRKEEDEDNI